VARNNLTQSVTETCPCRDGEWRYSRRTNIVAIRSGNVLAMIAKQVVINAADPSASTNRTRKHITA